MGMGDRLREKAFSQFLYLMRFEDSRSLASKNPLGLLGRMDNYAETILPYVTFNSMYRVTMKALAPERELLSISGAIAFIVTSYNHT